MLCPKCHSPLDGDGESYICCAGATLRWHCTACAKVSEGFAFPYGGCPLCGGALTRILPRTMKSFVHAAYRFLSSAAAGSG